MKLKRKNVRKFTLIISIILVILISFLSINKINDKSNRNDKVDVKEEINDELNFQYTIYDNENATIQLKISSSIGISKIIFPDNTVGEFNNKKVIETHYNISANGEYLFKVIDANGKETEKKIIVDNLGSSELNQDNNEENSELGETTDGEKPNNNLNNSINNNKNNNSSSNKNNSTNNTNNGNNNGSSNSQNNNTNNGNSNNNKEDVVKGTIYFNKPVGWSNTYIYIYTEKNSQTYELSGQWPGATGRLVNDNTYAFDITESMISTAGSIDNIKIMFNNGKYYKTSSIKIPGFNKIYNITTGALSSGNNNGEWIDYKESTIVSGGPVNTSSVKNVIFMIGDGMGNNHIKAAEIYSGNRLTVQSSDFNSTYVSTYSRSDFVTDSAAAATALATGSKTINYYVSIDYRGNQLETLAEYAHKKGMKTGLVATQMINHATPAAFSSHDYNRSNYSSITIDQINSGIDLIIGGGSEYFNTSATLELMANNNYTYITNFQDIYNIDNSKKVIGTFSSGSFHETSSAVPSLTEMTEVALNRLGTSNSGFFLMIEGSNIDSYSHVNDLQSMIEEVIEFDRAVAIAKRYVDSHPDTLLVVTADHETGGLNLNGATNRGSLLSNASFTSSPNETNKPHTAAFVKVYTYGKGSKGLTNPSLIDNTHIHNYIKQGLINRYGY